MNQLKVIQGLSFIELDAAIAQWFHLHLPSCGTLFDSPKQHAILNLNCDEKRAKTY